MCCEGPDAKGERGDAEYGGDKDSAGAVGHALEGRARALRLLHHARDLREHRVFAERESLADDCAVVVERSGENTVAGLPVERGGFAAEHGFVDCGAAFDDLGIDGEALAGKHQDVIAGADLFEGHEGFDSGFDAARSGGPKLAERIERGKRA